jgi:hypothetical protein
MSANPFDIRTVLLAKYAQHVVLIHFPIALFIAAAAFGYLAQWTKDRNLAAVAYFNLLLMAVSTVPVIPTDLAAWQWALEGQKSEEILLIAPTSGLPIKCPDLACILDPPARTAPSREILAKIPPANRSGSGVARGVDRTSWRVSQWRERARLDVRAAECSG